MITILVYLHILAAVIWIGAHFFEALILHFSMTKVPERAKYETYSTLLLRFNKLTGLSAVATLYFGIMLASTMSLGSALPLFTTPWGILSTIFAFALLIGLLVPLAPRTVSKLFNIGLGAAVSAGIAVLLYVGFTAELQVLARSRWGISILLGGLVAIGLLVIGASQGLRRIQLAVMSKQLLSGDNRPELRSRFENTERVMVRMTIPENLAALAVIALMVYARNPF
jgi:hypothetical protein